MTIDRTRITEVISQEKEIFRSNTDYKPFDLAEKEINFSFKDVEDAEARLQRFASFIRIAYPETEEAGGIIDSGITEITNMKSYLNKKHDIDLEGRLLLKRDDQLPISGTIKARGAIYEVLMHAENLALKNNLLDSVEDDYAKFATVEFYKFFSNYNITVGTTGNLGISVGTIGRKLGFNVTVHMSIDAKDWKKQYLRNLGVDVIEHKTNFTLAVTEGRAASEADPSSYFVDDEHSKALFFGYTAGGFRMKNQLAEYGIKVDEDHPLFVYLPCGIGGSPSGITYGLKQAFGDNVHCIFAEPTRMPSMLLGLVTEKFDDISVEDIQLGGKTVADGLAVPRTSGLVAKSIRHFFSGVYTLQDESFKRLLWNIYDQENIFLEPAAVAGIIGPYALRTTEDGQEYLNKHNLNDKLKNATHIAWATGGSMVPQKQQNEFIEEGRSANFPSISQ